MIVLLTQTDSTKWCIFLADSLESQARDMLDWVGCLRGRWLQVFLGDWSQARVNGAFPAETFNSIQLYDALDWPGGDLFVGEGEGALPAWTLRHLDSSGEGVLLRHADHGFKAVIILFYLNHFHGLRPGRHGGVSALVLD